MKLINLLLVANFLHHVEAFTSTTSSSSSKSLRVPSIIPGFEVTVGAAGVTKRSSSSPTTITSVTTTSSSTTALSMARLWKKKDPTSFAPNYPQTKSRILTSIVATIATWHAIAHNSLSPVLASSVTTIVLSLASPGLGQAAFCGSFAGMSSAGTLATTMVSATITAGLFELLIHRQNRSLGLGGRLGFVAFLAANSAAIINGNPAVLTKIPTEQWMTTLLSTLKSTETWVYPAICAAAGSAATIALREFAENSNNKNNDLQDPVRAASIIGLVSALAVGLYGFDDFGSLIAFGGAFTGMSLPSRLLKGVIPGRKKRNPPGAVSILFWYAIAGALGGIVHALTLPLSWWTGGVWGGKAGSCAYAGVLIFRGLEKIVYSTRKALGLTSDVDDYGELY